MTRSTLVNAVSEKTGHPPKDVDRIITHMYVAIRDALRNGETVELRGLGSFSMRLKRGREAHNFVSGKRYRIPDSYDVVFIPGRRLKALKKPAVPV